MMSRRCPILSHPTLSIKDEARPQLNAMDLEDVADGSAANRLAEIHQGAPDGGGPRMVKKLER